MVLSATIIHFLFSCSIFFSFFCLFVPFGVVSCLSTDAPPSQRGTFPDVVLQAEQSRFSHWWASQEEAVILMANQHLLPPHYRQAVQATVQKKFPDIILSTGQTAPSFLPRAGLDQGPVPPSLRARPRPCIQHQGLPFVPRAPRPDHSNPRYPERYEWEGSAV